MDNEEPNKTETEENPSPSDIESKHISENTNKPKTSRNLLVIILSILLLVGVVFCAWFFVVKNDNSVDEVNTSISSQEEHESDGHTHGPDYTALPLGDDLYSTQPKKGYVYSCQTSYNGSGAFEQGPWIDTENNTWDLTKKISVSGDESWKDAYWRTDEANGTRTLYSNDLPVGHNTGIFPVQSTDEAYQYDRNPNSISAQTIQFSVPLNPEQLTTPGCVGGEVGIALTGVLLFNAFDAGGRDAVATEIQDKCQGHPQAGSYYHYHGYSACFEDTSAEGEHSDLLGYAFDGFGIFGIKGEGGVELSSSDLDECHGHTHVISWDGKDIEMYHYHFTQDFPYTVSCFRGTNETKALSSGEGTPPQGNTNLPPSGQNGPLGPPPSQ